MHLPDNTEETILSRPAETHTTLICIYPITTWLMACFVPSHEATTIEIVQFENPANINVLVHSQVGVCDDGSSVLFRVVHIGDSRCDLVCYPEPVQHSNALELGGGVRSPTTFRTQYVFHVPVIAKLKRSRVAAIGIHVEDIRGP